MMMNDGKKNGWISLKDTEAFVAFTFLFTETRPTHNESYAKLVEPM